MIKILLFVFFIFTNFLFAEHKIIHNGYVYCPITVKNNNATTISIVESGNSTRILTKSLITFHSTGYKKVGVDCNRDISLYPASYDLLEEVKEENIDLITSSYSQKLKDSPNKIDDLFVVTVLQKDILYSTDQNNLCTTGKSEKFAYFDHFNRQLKFNNPNVIQSVYYGASLNLDTGTCSFPVDDTPLNVKSYFNQYTSFANSKEIVPSITTLSTLLKSKNNLPNQNSLENKFDIDTTSSSQNCNNSLYNLQEKLLCEMNAGLRKLNQESNPKYSLNNLISILITSNDKNAQDTNESIKSISAFEEVRLQKQKDTNTLLDTTVTKQNELNTTLANIETTLKGIETNTTGGIVSGGGSSGGTVTPEPEKIDLDKYLKPDENINLDDLNNINNDTDSIITTLFTSFTDFKTNITDSFDSINNQLDGLKETIQNPTNIFTKNTIINCPVTYQADFSAFGIGKKSLIVDYCEFTSRLQPIVYFFTYVSLFLGLIFFSFRFIGVLL